MPRVAPHPEAPARRTRRRCAPGLRAAVVVACAGLLPACGREPPAQRVIWSAGTAGTGAQGLFGSGDVCVSKHGGAWIAYSNAGGSVPRIRLLRLVPGESGEPQRVATFDGDAPGMLEVGRDRFAVVSIAPAPDSSTVVVLREGSTHEGTLGAPRPIASFPTGATLTSGRLVRSARGTWLLPVVVAGSTATPLQSVVCLRSEDAGRSWSQVRVVQTSEAAAPALAAAQAELVLVVRLGTGLARSLSRDDGLTWSVPEPIGITTVQPHALEGLSGGVALAWTDPPPDTTWSVPAIRAVRFAVSTDAGANWHRILPLVWRAGRTPAVTSLSFESGHLNALVEARSRHKSDLACIEYDVRKLDPVTRYTGRPQVRYAIDPGDAWNALELLTEQTLARPETSRKLFIEGYFMRSLVAAHEVLGSGSRQDGRYRIVDATEGLTRAVTFADWMLHGQDADGYWPLGYKAVYIADMAAVVGLYAALDRSVDDARRQAYVESARRFADALERDRMIQPSGAVGVGWMDTRVRSESTVVRVPYLVSTALAGLEVHAWLHARTGNPRDRERALAALEYTLGQLRDDGSFPPADVEDEPEGSFVAAAYVEEGWMAADVFLQSTEVLQRLRAGLPAHIAWLLRTQRPDGTWGSHGEDGEFARTPSIVDFLIWYDQRCEARDDVRKAILRASATLTNPDTWYTLGLARDGRNEEVMRAIAGRPLAALAAQRFIF